MVCPRLKMRSWDMKKLGVSSTISHFNELELEVKETPGGRGATPLLPLLSHAPRRNPESKDLELPATGAFEKSMATFSNTQALEDVAGWDRQVTVDSLPCAHRDSS
jgi:hypothetical protein